MDPFIVVAHPQPLQVVVRPMESHRVPEGMVALGYYYEERLIARGVAPPDAFNAIRGLLTQPVSVALAATEDDGGNIEGRLCLMLPVDPEQLGDGDDEDREEEPWRASLPAPPDLGSDYGEGTNGSAGRPHLALIPIGNVIRAAGDRNHPDEVAADVREMLENLLAGRGVDAVDKAIDDLLGSL